jgi:hypothetical protein
MRLNKQPKYPHGGVYQPVAESTSVQMPDPAMIQRLEDAQEAIDFEEMALQQRRRELPMGFVDDPAGLTSVDPLFEILSLGGPKLFTELGEAGVRQIAKFVAKTPKSQLDKLGPKEIVMKALDPMEELAERRAKENLEYVTDRIVKQAGAEDSGALINLQSKSDALLDDAIQQEISERISLANKVDDIFTTSKVDDVYNVKDVGDARDLLSIKKRGAEVGNEYQKLFEDLGLTADEAETLLRERFGLDPDAMKLDLTAYGKTNLGGQPGERFVRSIRSNEYGGVVPMKKAKKGLRLKKKNRYGR